MQASKQKAHPASAITPHSTLPRLVPAPFPRRLTFPLSCLVAITFTADMLILAADNHMGSRIKAAAAGVGPFVWGAVAGGGVVGPCCRDGETSARIVEADRGR